LGAGCPFPPGGASKNPAKKGGRPTRTGRVHFFVQDLRKPPKKHRLGGGGTRERRKGGAKKTVGGGAENFPGRAPPDGGLFTRGPRAANPGGVKFPPSSPKPMWVSGPGDPGNPFPCRWFWPGPSGPGKNFGARGGRVHPQLPPLACPQPWGGTGGGGAAGRRGNDPRSNNPGRLGAFAGGKLFRFRHRAGGPKKPKKWMGRGARHLRGRCFSSGFSRRRQRNEKKFSLGPAFKKGVFGGGATGLRFRWGDNGHKSTPGGQGARFLTKKKKKGGRRAQPFFRKK